MSILDQLRIAVDEWREAKMAELDATGLVRDGEADYDAVRKWNDQVPEIVHGEPCSRCGGSGWIRRYTHVQGGVCFRCRGSGVDPEATKTKRYMVIFTNSIGSGDTFETDDWEEAKRFGRHAHEHGFDVVVK
jgi:hypothetical protein